MSDAPIARELRARRSCHAVPGSNPRFLEKAQGLDSDQVFLDIEDSVAPIAKPDARPFILGALQDRGVDLDESRRVEPLPDRRQDAGLAPLRFREQPFRRLEPEHVEDDLDRLHAGMLQRRQPFVHGLDADAVGGDDALVDQGAGDLAARLDREHGVMTRAGLHCAPEAHALLGTAEGGAVRFSVGWATTEAEVDAATMRYDAAPDDPFGDAVWEDHAYGTGRAGWDVLAALVVTFVATSAVVHAFDVVMSPNVAPPLPASIPPTSVDEEPPPAGG